jgi:hypothetical protein
MTAIMQRVFDERVNHLLTQLEDSSSNDNALFAIMSALDLVHEMQDASDVLPRVDGVICDPQPIQLIQPVTAIEDQPVTAIEDQPVRPVEVPKVENEIQPIPQVAVTGESKIIHKIKKPVAPIKKIAAKVKSPRKRSVAPKPAAPVHEKYVHMATPHPRKDEVKPVRRLSPSPVTKITCVCQKTIQYRSYKRHQASDFHKDYMASHKVAEGYDVVN